MVTLTSTSQSVSYVNKKDDTPSPTTYCAVFTKLGAGSLTSNYDSATFGVYSTSTCSGSPTSTFTLSGSSMTKSFNGLTSNASFYIKETSAPTGYALSDTCVKVTPGTSCVSSSLSNSPYYISLIKKDEKGTAMSGATFKIKNSSGNYITATAKNNTLNNCYVYSGTTTSSSSATSFETNSNGMICVVLTPNGTYSAEETSSGNNSYAINTSSITGITTSTSTPSASTAKSVTNKPYLVNFFKVDASSNVLTGATF